MKYSVICPTLWKPDFFPSFLSTLNNSPLVDEIIIISNAPDQQPDLAHIQKVKVIKQSTNIGVNPAWNLGASLAKNDDLIFMNDDIMFESVFFNYIESIKNQDPNTGMIGINVHSNELLKVDNRPYGMNCLFYMNKKDYRVIPESLKIFFGDDWLVADLKDKQKTIYAVPVKTNGILNMSSQNNLQILNSEYPIFQREKALAGL